MIFNNEHPLSRQNVNLNLRKITIIARLYSFAVTLLIRLCLTFFSFFDTVPLLPPSNVSALSPSGTSVKVQWKAVPHQGQNGVIRGYIVFYKQCQSAGALERTATKNLHLTVFDLKAFTQYCFRVLSYNANGNGVASDQIKVTTMESGKVLVIFEFKIVSETPSAVVDQEGLKDRRG